MTDILSYLLSSSQLMSKTSKCPKFNRCFIFIIVDIHNSLEFLCLVFSVS